MDLMLVDNEDDHAAVIAAALALIEEAYASDSLADQTSSSGTPAPRRAVHDRLWLLREQVADLENRIAQHAYSQVSQWAQVAESQRKQRERVDQENELLRACVASQREVARHVCQALERICRLAGTVGAKTTTLASHICSHSAPVANAVLSHRLNEITAVASRKWLKLLPAVGPELRERDVVLNPTRDQLVFESRYACYLPFKLSLVVSELWALLLHDAFGTETEIFSKAPDRLPNSASGAFSLRLALSPSEDLDVSGPSVLKRVFATDGTVVLASASITAGVVHSRDQQSLSSAAVEGYELHELEWLRVGRVATAPSLVYLESTTRIEIIPTSDCGGMEKRLQRVADSLRRTCERIGERNIQRLENRLLDARRS
jgi:hypothetical protein